jgi:hypothetical protein
LRTAGSDTKPLCSCAWPQELEPSAPVREPALSQLVQRFRNLASINLDDTQQAVLRVEDATLPALLVCVYVSVAICC